MPERCDCPLPGPCRAKYFLLPANQTCVELRTKEPRAMKCPSGLCLQQPCSYCENNYGKKKEKSMFDPKKPIGFDFTKSVITRAGFPARIICTDRKGTHPIVGLIADGANSEYVQRYQTDGRVGAETSPDDLVNIKVKKWKWVYRMHPYGPLEVSGPCSEKMATATWSPSALMGRIQESMVEE